MKDVSWGSIKAAAVMDGNIVREVDYYANSTDMRRDGSGKRDLWVCARGQARNCWQARMLSFELAPWEFEDLDDRMIHSKMREWLMKEWSIGKDG